MKFLFICFYTIYCFTFITSKSDFDWWFENYTCTAGDSNIISALNCSLTKNVKRRTMYMEFKFAQDVTRWYFNLKMILPRKPRDFVVLNQTKIDGCQLLGNKNQVTILQLTRLALERYSNLPMHCPLQKDKLYYIRGFHFGMESLPSFGFETDVNVWYEVIVQKKIIIYGFVKSYIGLKNTKNRGKN